MKKFINLFYPFILGATLLVSCKDEKKEPSPVTPPIEIVSPEFKAALQSKGFNFDNKGRLLVDEKVKSTTKLDLSNSKLKELKGLELFPKLEEVNLSNNKFEKEFDFSSLPHTVVSVDLRNNPLYEFKGLVDVKTQENGDEIVKVLRPLKKLYLPHTAQYDCNQLVYVYEQNKNGSLDMQIQNNKNELVKYTTKREVPDANVRKELKKQFPSLFDGESIDISKRMIKALERDGGIELMSRKNGPFYDDFTGVEYVIHNRTYNGRSISLTSTGKKENVMPYLKINSKITLLALENIDTPNGIDLSNATSLVQYVLINNKDITTLDVSASKWLGQRNAKEEFNILANASFLKAENCPKLTEIKFPKAAKYLCCLYAVNLPMLKEVDLTQFDVMYSLDLIKLSSNTSIKYLSPKKFMKSIEQEPCDDGTMYVKVSEDISNRPETKAFLQKYSKNCKVSVVK
ncbi:hypothetical protein [Porphyromonas pogonae]|uniref:hypothetical protein n=1 Tax=Porphyromonas pogonae TaxID=867595 RepID=UPI002E765FBE|nr:hypothetical protein [Porphyromonas pogonae]